MCAVAHLQVQILEILAAPEKNEGSASKVPRQILALHFPDFCPESARLSETVARSMGFLTFRKRYATRRRTDKIVCTRAVTSIAGTACPFMVTQGSAPDFVSTGSSLVCTRAVLRRSWQNA